MAPQQYSLAASISCRVKPMAESRSKSGAVSRSASSFSVCVQKASPSVHLLNTNLMSKALASDFSTSASTSSVKPLALSAL